MIKKKILDKECYDLNKNEFMNQLSDLWKQNTFNLSYFVRENEFMNRKEESAEMSLLRRKVEKLHGHFNFYSGKKKHGMSFQECIELLREEQAMGFS